MSNLYNERLKHRYKYIIGIIITIMIISLYFIFIDKEVMSESEVKSIISEIDKGNDVIITNDNYVIGDNVYYTVHLNNTDNNEAYNTYYKVNTSYYKTKNEEIWDSRYCIDKNSKEVYIEFRDNPKHLTKHSDYKDNIDYALNVIKKHIHINTYDIEVIVEGDIYTIHVYEIVNNGDESHIATIGWYTFNVKTKEVKDIMSEEILK